MGCDLVVTKVLADQDIAVLEVVGNAFVGQTSS